MKFNYQARTKTGVIQTGIVEASSREAAINLLRSYNLYVTALEEIKVPFYAKKIRIFKISKKEIVALSRQLAIMFSSKVPLLEILETLARQTENLLLREKIEQIANKVEGGMALSKAFSLYPEIFSPFYVNMVRSGEVSGKLSETFSYLADYLEREYAFSRKVKGALIYPSFVLAVFFIVLAIMVVFVLPRFAQTLTEVGGELPLITKIVLGGADFLRKWFWFLILILISLIIFLFHYRKTEKGRKFFDQILLKIPLLKELVKKIYLANFASNLSTLISGGLPITQALEISAQVIGNDVYKSIILTTSEGVKRGEAISTILQAYPEAFPPLFIQMTVVGEKTGTLDSSLMNVVDFYQKEIDRSLDNFISYLEPILILFLGILVAILLVSVFLPLYGRLAF